MAQELQAGMRFGDFELLRRLGVGATGEVWLAYQPSMGRKIALKIMSPELLGDEESVSHFFKEARILAQLQHPNLIPVYGTGTAMEIPYLMIPFINGTSLEQRIENEGRIPEKEALSIAAVVADALEYAWQGFHLLHQDIKPSNIMQDADGHVMLMDFGVAKNVEEGSLLTSSGFILGTPYYMSPERGRAEKHIDFRSDLYSLGATLYHLVTGSLPYDAASIEGILYQHANAPFPDPVRHCPGLSSQCVDLLRSMLEKNPLSRPASWLDLKERIRKAMQVVPPTAKRAVPAGKPRKKPVGGLRLLAPGESFMAAAATNVRMTRHPKLKPVLVTAPVDRAHAPRIPRPFQQSRLAGPATTGQAKTPVSPKFPQATMARFARTGRSQFSQIIVKRQPAGLVVPLPARSAKTPRLPKWK